MVYYLDSTDEVIVFKSFLNKYAKQSAIFCVTFSVLVKFSGISHCAHALSSCREKIAICTCQLKI